MRLNSPFSRIARIRRALHRGEAAFRRGDLAAAETNGHAAIARLGYRIDHPTSAPIADPALLASSLELLAGARRELGDLTQSAVLREQALAALAPIPQSPYADRLRLTVLMASANASGSLDGTRTRRIITNGPSASPQTCNRPTSCG